MNGPVTTVVCPNGHASTNRAVCTACGVLIPAESRDGADSSPTAGAVPRAPASNGLRTESLPRHLAAAPPIDPTEARHMAPLAPMAPVAPLQSLPPFATDPSSMAPPAPAEPHPGSPGPPPAAPAIPPVAPTYQQAPPALQMSQGQVGQMGQVGQVGHMGQAMAGGHLCPHCSAELHPGARFCEVCGYDPSTGSLPHVYAPVVRPAVLPDAPPGGGTGPTGAPGASFGSTPSGSVGGAASGQVAPAPGAVAGRWTATITADRAYYDSHQVGDVQFPLGVPSRTIELPAGPVSIGRRSRSRGTNPAIDLAGPPEDPAVSHTHASLLPSDDGTWKLIDHGSTNGTFVNESLDALAANQPVRIVPGDRVYVGAWTRITLDLFAR